MTKQEQRLREIAAGAAIEPADVALIHAQADKMGVVVRNTNCGDCLRDAAIETVCAINRKNKSRKYVLRAGVDVIWKGERVNQTLTDEELAVYIERGFPTEFFIRINGEAVCR